MTATNGQERESLAPDQFVAEIEAMRADWRKQYPFRIREIMNPEEFAPLAATKRRAHMGGDINHRFEGERYFNSTDKATRRFQLRKLVDEGGQVTVGGPQVSHPLLSRWESNAYGVTPDEVDKLEKGDCDPAELVRRGWWITVARDSHFGVGIGSGCVAEGENKIHSAELIAALERDRERFEEWGVAEVDKALLNRLEHAGVDIDHANFNEDVVRKFVTTPELQDEMREVFTLRLQMTSGG